MFNIQFCHRERTGMFDVNTINTIECINNNLSPISSNWITHALGYYLHRHSRLNANAV